MKHITRLLLILIVATNVSGTLHAIRKPRLTVIFVIDQFAYHYIPKLCPFLNGGIYHMTKYGVFYKNAYYPHAITTTATGHTGLSTGCYAKDHGIISNSWFEPNGEKTNCDSDGPEKAAVFSPTGLYDYGRSAHNIMTDGISDQFVMASQPGRDKKAIAISLKSRAAIGTANKMGKAIWFDGQAGQFTSSKAYYNQLPAWVTSFNNAHKISGVHTVTWNPKYPLTSKAYCFKNIYNYDHCACKKSVVGKSIAVREPGNTPYDPYLKTPMANKLLLDLALQAIRNNITRDGCEELLLWVDLSPLDKVGHDYGPESIEIIDMIYHLDCQIQEFMNCVNKCMKRHEILYVMTADHGVTPAPEIVAKEGFTSARRVLTKPLEDAITSLAKEGYGLADLSITITNLQLYMYGEQLKKLAPEKHTQLLNDIQKYLSDQPGIKKVWRVDELKNTWYEPNQIESFFKSQTYPGRNGVLYIQPQPYCAITEHQTGSCHRTPYEPDRHVPLILYQKKNIEKQVVYDHVWTLQLANTLAHILEIQKPSQSTFDVLPGIIVHDPVTGEVLEPVKC